MKFPIRLLSIALLFNGGVMAQQQDWPLIKDAETGVEARFPHPPLEMTFELPFQNTPPTGYLHLYSVPTQEGVFVLSLFKSSDLSSPLQKETFKDFFEHLLVPRLFYYPHVFQERQKFHYTPQGGETEASFEFNYRDHGIEKKLEGRAVWRDQILSTYFYLASKKNFNQETLEKFLNSVHFPKVLSQD